jgi:predicted nucleic-acid-binding protein
MIGLDTNVLVRYIVEDDPDQAELARIAIEDQCTTEEPGFISLMVVCELVWVLQRAYKCTRDQVGEVVMNLLLTETFSIEHHDVAWQAYHDYVEGNADYADCLISRLNHATGCTTTVTFDKKAAKLPHSTMLTKGSI